MWGGWFQERDWKHWQAHMEKLIGRMDELLTREEKQLHYGQEAFARRWNREKWQERKKGKNVRTHIGRRRKA